jgi:hypothetical protein
MIGIWVLKIVWDLVLAIWDFSIPNPLANAARNRESKNIPIPQVSFAEEFA